MVMEWPKYDRKQAPLTSERLLDEEYPPIRTPKFLSANDKLQSGISIKVILYNHSQTLFALLPNGVFLIHHFKKKYERKFAQATKSKFCLGCFS